MRQVYLFDISTLGRAAFRSGLKAHHNRTCAFTNFMIQRSSTAPQWHDGQELLESVDVVKLFYDCRSDADALHHLHGVQLTNVRLA